MTYGSNTFASGLNFQSHEQQDISDQHCFTGGRCCSVVLSFATWVRACFLLAWRRTQRTPIDVNFQTRLTFLVPWYSMPDRCLTRLARMLMWVTVSSRFHEYSSRWLGSCQKSSQSFQSCPWSFCRLLHLFSTSIRLELFVTPINWQVLQAPNNLR